MNNNIEVKVNVINQLKLFKQSTFKDVLCFLDEDIQNAQRAKATEIKITTNRYDDIPNLVIENNGKILDNPQSLFSIAESGWNDDTVKNENPFGIGFFSNITVSSNIEIYSGNKYILFDVNKMISTGNTELEVTEVEDYYSGFKLILNGFKYDEIYEYQIRDRVKNLAKYIHELDIYYNDEIQDKKDLTEADTNYVFSKQIKLNDIEGWVAFYSNYGFDSELRVYYKGRLITNLNGYPYLVGDIHINDRVLNLTSPDRKDIIKDEKYRKFKELLDSQIKILAEESFEYGEDSDIQKYYNAINRYINKDKLIRSTKFSVFKGEDKIKYLSNIAKIKRENKNIETFKDYNCYLDKEKSKQSESNFEEIVIEEEMKSDIPEAKGVVFTPSQTRFYESKVTKPEIKENNLKERDGEILFENEDIKFWIGFNELDQFEYKFNILNHYGIKLIVSRNNVEQEILKTLEKTNNIHHISKLVENISFKSTISNTELNLKESRALMIFDMISRIFNSDHNLFSIGDVMTIKTVSVENTNINNEMIDENVVIIKDSSAKKVYVDRSIIDSCSLEENLDENLTLKDIQFILMNIENICDSLNLLVGMTTDKIREKLLMTIAYMK